MQEKPLVLHILDIVRGLGPTTTVEASVSRIPSYTTLLLAHALRGVFYPSNFIYPLTARFLLQRPMMDPTDVPMLLSMLYSSGDDWKKERAWILRFLADGMTCGRDWKVFKRRHTWDLIASLFQASEKDKTLRQGALDVSFRKTSRCRRA
jgi:nucleolar pre-ribosomal-associated protein 1